MLVLRPDGVAVEGVLMASESVPVGLPACQVEFFSEQHIDLDKVLLKPEEVLRTGHATDHFMYLCKQNAESRENFVAQTQLHKMKKYSEIADKVENVKRERDEKASAERLAAMNRDNDDDGAGQDLSDPIPMRRTQ